MNNKERMEYIEKFTELRAILERYKDEEKGDAAELSDLIEQLEENIDFLSKGQKLDTVHTEDMKKLKIIIESLLKD